MERLRRACRSAPVRQRPASRCKQTTPYSSPDSSRSSDAQCDANGARSQRFRFNTTASNPLSSGSDYHIRLTLAGPITQTATVAADIQEPFIGQSVTMRASTSAAFGTASTHQWQEWSSGQWSNLASATSSSHVVTSSASGVRTFRVAVANASSTTENSLPISIQWRPMVVTVAASPDYPESGTVSKRTVTLTANADAPTGVTYQWQEGSGDSWTNLGTSSTSESTTVSTTTRATRKFRVHVSHSVVPSVESEPVYVTWDEFAIVGDLAAALSASTTSNTFYTTAQNGLVNCVNNAATAAAGSGGASGASSNRPIPSFTTFQGVLNNYTGKVKTWMEPGGVCNGHANTMFSTNERLSTTTLASLKSASSTYAGWLETPQGSAFEDELGDPDVIKLVSFLGAYVADPGWIETPVYRADSDSGLAATTTPTQDARRQTPGLGCLPAGIVGQDLTLNNKLKVLNCLVFATPHSFWVQGSGTREGDTLRQLITNSSSRFAWLDSGDWKCSDPPVGRTPQGPVPSCLKHDVGYGSLQKFDGEGASDPLTAAPDSEELDSAWNPRNKALADHKYKADITRWGCQDQSGSDAAALCEALSNAAMAQFPYFWAVAHRNNKGWPITSHDIADFADRPTFENCGEPPVPSFTSLQATRSGSEITISGTLVQGCVEVPLRDVRFGIDRLLPFGKSLNVKKLNPTTECTMTGNDFACTFSNSVLHLGVGSIGVYVIPRDKEYGGSNYGRDDKRGRGMTVEF